MDYTFKSYEVYFLRKDLELMRRHIEAGIKLGACTTAISAGVYFLLGWQAAGLGLLAFSTIPLLRGLYMRYRTKRTVSSVWLSKNLKTVDIVYGLDLKVAKGPIENFKPIKTMDLKTTSGFKVIFDFTDDGGKQHSMLEAYIEPRICEIDNVMLVSKLLTGKTADIEKFRYVGEPVFDHNAKSTNSP